jgi:hypothetical protein
MRSSRLPAVRPLRDVGFTFQPSLRREQIESLHELGFVDRRENMGLEEWGVIFGDDVIAAALIDRSCTTVIS